MALTCDPQPAEAPHRIHELTSALAASDRFLALVGHELRNSVAPILLLAEQFATLAEGSGSRTVIASRAAILTRNLNKFVAAIDRVAEVADLRRGRLQLDPAMIDLTDVVEQVCRAAQREATAATAELIIDATGPVTGRWDRARVKQIVSNLVSNAIRYGGGGRVELAVRGDEQRGELVIRDHGPGFDPAALPRLFEGFDHDPHRRRGGFGIGLWVIKTLCTAMHGSVTAENCCDGGARFCVVLPRG